MSVHLPSSIIRLIFDFYFTVEECFPSSKEYYKLLELRYYYKKFPMNELLEKVKKLKPFDTRIINEIWDCYKCLVCYSPLKNPAVTDGMDYLNNITLQDMNGRVNIGIDRINRPYVSLKIHIDTMPLWNSFYCKSIVVTLFQRGINKNLMLNNYSSNTPKTWCIGTKYSAPPPYCFFIADRHAIIYGINRIHCNIRPYYKSMLERREFQTKKGTKFNIYI